MQYSYFSVISGFPYQTEDPFRNCSCSSPEISLLVLKIFQHSKRNFVSPRGHVISSIVTCDQAIFTYIFFRRWKKTISPPPKRKNRLIAGYLYWSVLVLVRGLRNEEYYISSALTDSKIGGYKVTGGKSLEGELRGYHAHTLWTPWEKTDHNSPGKEVVKTL